MDNMDKNQTAVQEPQKDEMATQAETQVMKSEDTTTRQTYLPAADIIDREGETILYMDVPGVDQSGLDISVEKNILSIKASIKDDAFEGKNLIYSEYGIGDYERSFTLSDEVDKERISASIKDGVLQVTLPKAAPVSKKISVSAS